MNHILLLRERKRGVIEELIGDSRYEMELSEEIDKQQTCLERYGKRSAGVGSGSG